MQIHTHNLVLPWAKYTSRHFGNTDSLKFYHNHKLHIIVGETEAKRGKAACPRSYQESWDLNLGSLALETLEIFYFLF